MLGALWVLFVDDEEDLLAGLRQVAADILSRHPVLVPPAGSIIHPFVERVMLEQGMAPPTQAVETVSDSFGRAFLRATNAIWIISRGVVAAELGLLHSRWLARGDTAHGLYRADRAASRCKVILIEKAGCRNRDEIRITDISVAVGIGEAAGV